MKKFFISLFLILPVYISAQTQWFNPLEENNEYIHGRAWGGENKDNFFRLPPRAKDYLRTPLWELSQESAGLSVVFKTNANKITVKYGLKKGHSMPHMPATGVSGVDLYLIDGENHLWCEGKYAFGDTTTFQYRDISYQKQNDKQNTFQLYLPLYNKLSWLKIGVDKDSFLEFVPLITIEKPIVIYGTSIAQGACASRPGMAWTNILGRKINTPIINLGFSGNGKLEPEIFTLLTEIDAALYVIDCMPNMYINTDQIDKLIEEGIDILRSKSDVPILLVEHCGYNGALVSAIRKKEFEKTNFELKHAYNKAIKNNIPNIYYLSSNEINLSNDSQVDGIHASDLGMSQYAHAYAKKIKAINCKSKTKK